MAMEFPKNFKYSKEKAENEAREMQEIADKNTSKEEYDIAEELIDEKKEETRKEQFDTLLKDKFDDFVPGNFPSKIPGINEIRIVGGLENSDGKTESLHIKLVGEDAGKIRTADFVINNNGTLTMGYKWGKVYFEKLGISEEEIYDEILRITELEKIGLFTKLSSEILPGKPHPEKEPEEPQGPPESPTGPEEGGERGEEELFDPMRIDFISNHKDLLFGISGSNGFKSGYHGFVFPNAIIYDDVNVGNPMLIYEFDNKIDTNKHQMDSQPSQRLTRAERDKIIEKYNIDYVSTLSRKKFQELGGFRKYNPQRFRIETTESESKATYEKKWRGRWEKKVNKIIETYGA